MLKRFISISLLICLLVSGIPFSAAESGEVPDILPVEEETVITVQEEAMEESPWFLDDFEGTSNQELFDAYVYNLLDGVGLETVPRMYSMPLPTNLSAEEYAVEQAFKQMVQEIAAGKRTSTILTVDLQDYGISDKLDVERIKAIFQTLRKDCAVELYWWDFAWKYGSSSQRLVLYLPVSSQYTTGTDEENYVTDPTAVQTAMDAIANAQSILTDCAGLSDYEKLKAYVQHIEALSDYNSEAAASSTHEDNNPWEIIYVFDGHPDTKVVCEGYSKAYQYLCDHSQFNNSQINCYCVSGVVRWNGGSGGGHMWNIVTMDDGRNYLVDVTNCHKTFHRFLLYAVSGSVEEGYTVTTNDYYPYDAVTRLAYTDAALTVSTQAYVQPTPTPTPAATPKATPTAKPTEWEDGPDIVLQPTSVTAVSGKKATFTVKVTGAKVAYQWQVNDGSGWVNIPKATKNSYSLTASKAVNGNQYRCLLTHSQWQKHTDAVTLHVTLVLPTVLTQPKNQEVRNAKKATFSVKAKNAKAYQWEVSTDGENWEALPKATKASYSFTADYKTMKGKLYRCKVSNGDGDVYSDAAALSVYLVLPTVVTQPKNVSIRSGKNATFSVKGKETKRYQWQVSRDGETWVDVPGATKNKLTLKKATVNMTGNMYRCVLTNADGETESGSAYLEVYPVYPQITAQPKDVTIKAGKNATFTVKAKEAKTYQWQVSRDGENWIDVPKATGSKLTIKKVTAAMTANMYRCIVSNADGSVESNVATMTVN